MDHRDCSWVDLLPMALLRLRMTPRSHGYSPYEIVYGRPPPIIKQVSTNLPQVRGDGISQQMEQLGKIISQVTTFVQERVQFPLGEQIHEFMPGNQVWVKDWKHDSLAPRWKGPYVILTTPAAATAAKSLQSCPTLCDPINSSPPGSPVPGILQARTLEWVAISFSNA